LGSLRIVRFLYSFIQGFQAPLWKAGSLFTLSSVNQHRKTHRLRNEISSSNEGNRGPSLTLYQNKSREGSVTSKQFVNNTISLNADGGSEGGGGVGSHLQAHLWPSLRFHAKDQPRCASRGLSRSVDSSFTCLRHAYLMKMSLAPLWDRCAKPPNTPLQTVPVSQTCWSSSDDISPDKADVDRQEIQRC
jgi:hypothetical protein